MKVLALILGLMPGTLLAQSLAERLAAEPVITFEAWRALTKGNTVVYEINGETYGYERYFGGGDVTIQLEDGSCLDGTWYMAQTSFCFNWEDGPLNCFNHKRLDDEVYVIRLNDGAETSDIQKVSRIANIPITCGPALLSSLPPQAHP